MSDEDGLAQLVSSYASDKSSSEDEQLEVINTRPITVLKLKQKILKMATTFLTTLTTREQGEAENIFSCIYNFIKLYGSLARRFSGPLPWLNHKTNESKFRSCRSNKVVKTILLRNFS